MTIKIKTLAVPAFIAMSLLFTACAGDKVETPDAVDGAVPESVDPNAAPEGSATDAVQDGAGAATDAVQDGAGAAGDAVQDGADAAGDAVQDGADAVKDGADAATDAVKDGAAGQ
jgi:hypothetical protein